MFQFEKVYERAIDNYGLITTESAAELSIHRKELLYWTKIGRLIRCGRGVYRLNHYVPTDYDRYAEAIALVGGDAMIFGESVLAMHNLALVNPPEISVAVANRVRRELPPWIRVIMQTKDMRKEDFNGIPCQRFADAMVWCKRSVMRDRLLDAIPDAVRQGLLTENESEELRKELMK